MRKISIGFSVILVILLGLLALNWGNIQRLLLVKDFLDPDNVVTNFAQAGDAFHKRELEVTVPEHKWDREPQALPAQINLLGKTITPQSYMEATDTVALLVIKDDKVLFEDYYKGAKAEDHRISWSVAKSFLSSLIGAAIDRGEIKSVNDTMDTYAPALKGTVYEGVAIKDVLRMSSGVRFSEDYFDNNSDVVKMTNILAIKGSLDEFTTRYKDRDFKPGEFIRYVSIDTHAIGMVLSGATGKSPSENFEDVLGSQLGFSQGIHYITDSEGGEYVLGGLNMSARDYALFGKLFLQDGVWDDQQLISKSWVDESTARADIPRADGGPLGYGYQWWRPILRDGTLYQDDYYAAGFYGQFIYVNPEANMIIVKLSVFPDSSEKDENGLPQGVKATEFFRELTAYYAGQ